MNIAFVSSMTPTSAARYLAAGLCQAGHKLFICSDVPCENVDVRVSGAFDLPALLARHSFAPDLILFVEGGTMGLLPIGSERVGCISAWFGIDSHIDFNKHRRTAPLFDVSFIAQKDYVALLAANGVQQVAWLPLAYGGPDLLDVPKHRDIDVAYVGSTQVSANPTRHELIETLRQEFPSHYLGTATPEALVQIYSSAKVVFNRSVNNDVNMRFFEAMGAGAVLLTDRIVENGADEMFTEGVHYLRYDGRDDLVATLKGILADPSRRAEISSAAQHLVMSQHTYRHRARQIESVVAESQKLAPPDCVEVFGALLVNNHLAAALLVAGRAFRSQNRGRYGTIVGSVMAGMLWIIAQPFRIVERFRRVSDD